MCINFETLNRPLGKTTNSQLVIEEWDNLAVRWEPWDCINEQELGVYVAMFGHMIHSKSTCFWWEFRPAIRDLHHLSTSHRRRDSFCRSLGQRGRSHIRYQGMGLICVMFGTLFIFNRCFIGDTSNRSLGNGPIALHYERAYGQIKNWVPSGPRSRGGGGGVTQPNFDGGVPLVNAKTHPTTPEENISPAENKLALI